MASAEVSYADLQFIFKCSGFRNLSTQTTQGMFIFGLSSSALTYAGTIFLVVSDDGAEVPIVFNED